jgi:recombination protein RecA
MICTMGFLIWPKGYWMAKAKNAEKGLHLVDDDEDFTAALISAINKEHGERVAYNLAFDESPTHVKRWIGTGSTQLDYAIRNEAGGGYPEGRVIEISGMPSTGKSHLAYHAAANVQKQGGLVVYIDTENATPIEKLARIGIDVRKRFIYASSSCTEEVFSIIESTILKAKQIVSKDIPILVVWDSVAATSPRAELDGEMDQQTVGLQARVIGKGMRKNVGLIGDNNITLLCLNQLREAIGVQHGDPLVTPGGKAIPFAASVRVRLGSGKQVTDAAGNVIGCYIICTIKKNKLAPSGKKYFFNILFGKGIVEGEFIFDEVRAWCAEKKNKFVVDGKHIEISGTSSWRVLNVLDDATGDVVLTKKFYKSDFDEVRRDPQYEPYVTALIDRVYTQTFEALSLEEENEVTVEEGVEET